MPTTIIVRFQAPSGGMKMPQQISSDMKEVKYVFNLDFLAAKQKKILDSQERGEYSTIPSKTFTDSLIGKEVQQ